MFIAMNRFKVAPDAVGEFETMWRERDSHLREMDGFVEFHMLRGPERADHVLYASHTVWTSKAAFEAWTRSEQFRRSHARAPSLKPLYLGHPEFEGFDVVQTLAG
jgi:heme-degrading monooxygenase HmoA